MERDVEIMEMDILLDDVRKDAIRKSQGLAVTEQVYSAIIEIIKLVQVARKEGSLALEEAMKNDIESGQHTSDLKYITILPMGIEYIVDGLEDNRIVGILTTKYWVKNPQGMEALAYYICIQGIMSIRAEVPVYYLEALLTALLPEECLAEYERRKEERIPKQVSKTQMEVLLEKKLALPRRSIIIRNVLEEKMKQTAESVMKASIQSLDMDDDGWSAILLRGLSKEGRKKLLSCMSLIRRNAVLEVETCMGPVRTIDIEDIMVKFLECLEETENENEIGQL